MPNGFPDPTIGQTQITSLRQLSPATVAQLSGIYPYESEEWGLITGRGTWGAGEETEDTIFNGEDTIIPPVIPPVIPTVVTTPGVETDGVVTTLGMNGEVTALPVIAPLVAAGAVAAIRALIIRFGGRLSVGLFVAFIKRWGAVAVKMAIGVLAFNELMDLVGLGADPSTIIDVKLKKKRKRYTIGYNPRVRTLQKVARHTMRLLKRHRKYIDEFFPRQKKTYGIPPARALSAIERKAISG